MDNKKQIIHIVHRDRFATGYIEFMRMYFNEYVHRFVLLKGDTELDLESTEDIYYIEQYEEMLHDVSIFKALQSADKIIVSGIWNMIETLYKCGSEILTKCYFHFWGGDFYRYRNIPYKWSQRHLHKDKYLLKKCLQKSAAVVNLIEEDYTELKRILGIKDMKHFVAPMCKNPKENIDYASYRNLEKTDNVCRILVGNSATVHNQHEEILKILSKYANENIEIYCPLSYGWKEYGDKVIALGEEYFGDKFHPLTEQLPKEKYVEFLATCDIGIYNNNRQQAMGNISILARLGKKVYLRDDTAMWSHFEKIGYRFNKISELQDADFEDITVYSEEQKNHNIQARELWEQQTIVLWKKVLCDNL